VSAAERQAKYESMETCTSDEPQTVVKTLQNAKLNTSQWRLVRRTNLRLSWRRCRTPG